MGKGRIFGSIAALVSIVAAASWSGCGTSNDQGISFRALGYFADGAGTTGDSERCANFGDDVVIPQSSGDRSDSNPGGGGFLGLQNTMLQGINLDHIDLSYHVNGSSLFIPNDTVAISGRLGPTNGTAPEQGSTTFLQSTIVSSNTMNFMNNNRSRLPPTPFEMVVDTSAVGVTDSGDVFRTNVVHYQITFVSGSEVCPTAPTATPASSGTPRA